MMRFLFLIFLAMMTLSDPVHAGSSYGKTEIDAFCTMQPGGKAHPAPPAPGLRFDGEPADKSVMALAPGNYSGANGAMIHLYDTGYFLISMPENTNDLKGTGGDDFMAPRTLGGCSREQLSEALDLNALQISGFSPDVTQPPKE